MCTAAKEARESHYWLRLIRDSFPAAKDSAERLLPLADELLRLLTAITKTTKNS
jgi:four helix bundle protein